MPSFPPSQREPDLVDLFTLPGFRFDIRYVSNNNFLGTVVYPPSPRVFLQRPAAEALARAHRRLATHGFGILVHDAYRPWHVTWMFWEATPLHQRQFVADPSLGSLHNRGCAVDCSLYALDSLVAVEMPSVYDEFTRRAYADFEGGTSVQRWHRDVLRHAMEAEGFTVNPSEWWHFDYADWRLYGVLDVPV